MTKQFMRNLLVCYFFVSFAFASITVKAKVIGQRGELEQETLAGNAGQANPAQVPPGFDKVGDLKPTFYWIALETQSSDPKNRNILDINGGVIARTTARFFSELQLEGTGRLLDGRMVNFHQFIQGPNGREIRYRICGPEAPYGYGYGDRPLTPFRTVAVDPRVIPLDSKIFIPAAVGAKLPDGSIHDGYFDALDIGGAITDLRVDVFTSFGDQSQVFIRNGMTNMRAIPVYVRRP